jgi:phthalate 4,5-dioxygenase oxygenase subunit
MAMTEEELDTLTSAGAGTPMGKLLRRYWVPALGVEELPEPDCPPVRIKLMGEELLAFRDTDGRVGIIEERCAHRCASLFFGRNEEGGIRCAYHGWKYDVTGRCVDMPSEPEKSRFKERINLTAYPCVESGGIIWTYMGPPELRPPEPQLEWASLPAGHRYVSKRLQESNWVQALEGGMDSSHLAFAHRFTLEADPLHAGGSGVDHLVTDTRPRFEVVEVDGGLVIGARREAGEENYYWRVSHWIMPWFTLIPPHGVHPLAGHAWVPIDDHNCWAWSINFNVLEPLTEEQVGHMREGQGIHVRYEPGSYRPVANKDNDYLVDRAAQKANESFSGIRSISSQDASMQESMGSIQDRTRENLATSDIGILMARRRLLRAAHEVAEGAVPPGLNAESQNVRSASTMLPRSSSIAEKIPELTKVLPDQDAVRV